MTIYDDGDIRPLTTPEIAAIMTEAGDPITDSGVRWIVNHAIEKLRRELSGDGIPSEGPKTVAHRRNGRKLRTAQHV